VGSGGRAPREVRPRELGAATAADRRDAGARASTQTPRKKELWSWHADVARWRGGSGFEDL